jgi:hypothetical protein
MLGIMTFQHAVTFGCVVAIALAFFCIWCIHVEIRREARADAKRFASESAMRRQQLQVIVTLILEKDGGVAQRMAEHERLVQAIATEAPHLAKAVPELAEWLNRHDQFYKSISAAIIANVA